MSKLLDLFHPHKKVIWKKLSEEIDADYVPGKGWRGRAQIRAYHANWTIVIDTYKRPKQPTYTRIRAHYVNADSFYFRIFRRPLLEGPAKAMGMQDVVVGYSKFDKDFIIQGNDEHKLQQLFSNDRIRQIIQWQPDIMLQNVVDDNWMTDPFREGISELKFQVKGVIAHTGRLRDLYNLFSELLNHLCHLGSAYEDDPRLIAQYRRGE